MVSIMKQLPFKDKQIFKLALHDQEKQNKPLRQTAIIGSLFMDIPEM